MLVVVVLPWVPATATLRAAFEDPGKGCGARYYGDGPTACLQKLGVRLRYGRRDHHLLSVPYVVRGVPDVDRDACLAQPAGVRGFFEIRARDTVTSSREHLGYTAHPGPADSDHVDVHWTPLLLSGTQQSPGNLAGGFRGRERGHAPRELLPPPVVVQQPFDAAAQGCCADL